MQKLFTAKQIRTWDAYTIKQEPISSINLMERASIAFVNWFVEKYAPNQQVYIFCGPGNNGGDGLAISRLLQNKGYQITPFLVNKKNKISADCKHNLNRLSNVVTIENLNTIPTLKIHQNDIIIDALFGSGLTRPVTGIYASLIEKLKRYNCIKIAVDIPSGMYCDLANNSDDIIFKTDIAVSFQIPKRAFFFIENKIHLNTFEVVDIGLSNLYYTNTDCNWYYINSTAEIPNFNINEAISFSLETFSLHFDARLNAIDVIALLIETAVKQQQIIILKASTTYIATPKQQIYFIFK